MQYDSITLENPIPIVSRQHLVALRNPIRHSAELQSVYISEVVSTHCTVRKALLFTTNSEESIARRPLLTKSEQDAMSVAQLPMRQVHEIIVIDDKIGSPLRPPWKTQLKRAWRSQNVIRERRYNKGYYVGIRALSLPFLEAIQKILRALGRNLLLSAVFTKCCCLRPKLFLVTTKPDEPHHDIRHFIIALIS